jgi:eukaryotic translation initiation factor 2C
MLQIASGMLEYPTLQYGRTRTKPENPRWDLRNKSLFKTSDESSFTVLVIVENGVYDSTIKKCRARFEEFFDSRYSVAKVTFLPDKLVSPTNYETVRKAMQDQRDVRRFNFATLLLNRKNVEAYGAFKNICDREYGVHSICVTRDAINRNGWMDCLSNITLKTNLKAAGSNHTSAGDGSVLQDTFKDTLVLGADVTHPGPGALMACPSIASIVGSVDNHAGRFLGSMRLERKDNKEVRTQPQIILHGMRLI